jgi:circadian clock protein KaiC
MVPNDKNRSAEYPKAPSGIQGFDDITHGGMPRGKVTLVTGGPGSGKTMFALQALANGAFLWDEPGIFVAIEENSRQIIANALSSGLNLPEPEQLFFLDAMPDPDDTSFGEFDFSRMLGALTAKVQEMNARRIAFDALDVLLRLLPGAVEERKEMDRLHEWLVANNLTAVVTAKLNWHRTEPLPLSEAGLRCMPFMVDCVIVLTRQPNWPS